MVLRPARIAAVDATGKRQERIGGDRRLIEPPCGVVEGRSHVLDRDCEVAGRLLDALARRDLLEHGSGPDLRALDHRLAVLRLGIDHNPWVQLHAHMPVQGIVPRATIAHSSRYHRASGPRRLPRRPSEARGVGSEPGTPPGRTPIGSAVERRPAAGPPTASSRLHRRAESHRAVHSGGRPAGRDSPAGAADCMFVATARITIHLPYSRSLKEKRQTVRSLVARLHQAGNLAAAEVGTLDQWQLVTIGVAGVSNEGRHADALVANALNVVERYLTEGIVTDVQTEIVSVLSD
jgi:uncharacterized protein YlxP (DUF503 family)